MKKVLNPVLWVLLLLGLQVAVAQATNVVTLSGRFQIASVTGAISTASELKTGDAFDFQFSFDLDNPTLIDDTYELFMGIPASMQLSRVGTNVGTWNPSGGSFLASFLIADELPGLESVQFGWSGASGFPTVGGESLNVMDFTFSTTTNGPAVTEVPVGGTLSQTLGGTFNPGNFGTSLTRRYVTLLFSSGNATASMSNLTVVPEPGSAVLLALGLGAWGVSVRRRRHPALS